jgi:uncharacterized protein YggE
MATIERPWGVSVRGTAEVRARPDLARITFRVTRMESTPAAAFAATNDAVTAVRRVLGEHAIADEALEGSRLGLTTLWSYADSHRTFLGYECQATFTVEAPDLDGVESLLVDLVAAGAHEIESVQFDVRNRADLLARARRQAVEAARDRAELYTQAAGVRLGAVVHIDDVEPEHAISLGFDASRSAPGSGPGLAPGHVVLGAAVTLGFAIAQA